MPFMTMPDAVGAILRLDGAEASHLTTRVYNIAAFSPSAAELKSAVLTHFPDARTARSSPSRGGRRSWTRGPQAWTTRARAATGDTRRGIDSPRR